MTRRGNDKTRNDRIGAEVESAIATVRQHSDGVITFAHLKVAFLSFPRKRESSMVLPGPPIRLGFPSRFLLDQLLTSDDGPSLYLDRCDTGPCRSSGV